MLDHQIRRQSPASLTEPNTRCCRIRPHANFYSASPDRPRTRRSSCSHTRSSCLRIKRARVGEAVACRRCGFRPNGNLPRPTIRSSHIEAAAHIEAYPHPAHPMAQLPAWLNIARSHLQHNRRPEHSPTPSTMPPSSKPAASTSIEYIQALPVRTCSPPKLRQNSNPHPIRA